MTPVLILLLLPVALCAPGAVDDNLIVTTKNGQLQGFVSNNTRAFLGIPYGAAPAGNLRWRPPQPAAPWSGVYQATSFAADCMQTIKPPYGVTKVSEDCLYLNVWTPLNATATSNLAVMVWINPGKFIGGAGHEYHGNQIIEQGNVIYVTFNHRVGVFGYLALPSLGTEDPAMGNYGQLDQRLLFQWVQQNIQAFGGDPSRVTVFGESSGGISVCWHLVAQKSYGLFQQGLMESGFCDIWTLTKQQSVGQEIAANVSCTQKAPADQLSCLRSVDAWALLNASLPQAYMLPTVDGVEIPLQPWALLQAGKFQNIPVLMGNNRNEAGLQVCPSYANISFAKYDLAVLDLYGIADGAEILTRYKSWDYPTPAMALVDLATDGTFVCPTKMAAHAISDYNGTVYHYSFKHLPGWSDKCYGVSHTFELPFLFHNYITFTFPDYQFTPGELELSVQMINYWTSFANTGVPQGPVTWPTYHYSSDENIVLDIPISTESAYKTEICKFWDKINSKNPTAREAAVDWRMRFHMH